MPTLAEAIQTKTQAFVADVALLMREVLLEALNAPAPSKPRSPTSARRDPPIPNLSPGEKRSPEHLAALIADVGTFITGNPGRGIEAIAKGMRLTTRELNLPIKKLIADGSIRTEGEKRARKYFPRKVG